MDGSLLARVILTLKTKGRVQPCVRPVDAAHVAAGPNVVRGSGPNQNRIFRILWLQRVFPTPGSTGFALRHLHPARSGPLNAGEESGFFREWGVRKTVLFRTGRRWQRLVARAIIPVLVHVIRGDRMGVPSQNHLTVGVVSVFSLGAATMVVPGGEERRRGTAD